MGDAKQTLVLIRPVLNQRKYDFDAAFFEALTFALGLLLKVEAAARNVRVVDLAGESATKKQFNMATKPDKQVDIIVFMGHGHKNGAIAMGQHKKPLLHLENIHHVAGRGVFCFSCHCSKTLGAAAIAAGAEFFVGFGDKFYLTDEEGEQILARCMLKGLLTLMDGGTPTEAWWAMESACQTWIAKLEDEQQALDTEWFVTAGLLRLNLGALDFMTKGG